VVIHKGARVQDVPCKGLARLSGQVPDALVPARDGAEPAARGLPVAVAAVDKVMQRVAVAGAVARGDGGPVRVGRAEPDRDEGDVA